MTLKSMIIYHIYPDDQTCYSWREKLVLSGDLHVFAWENQNILKKGPESCLLSLSIMRCKGYVGDDNTAAFAAVCFERMIQREQELWMHPTIIVDNNWYNRYCEYRWTARKPPPAWAFDELTWMQIRTQIQTFFVRCFPQCVAISVPKEFDDRFCVFYHHYNGAVAALPCPILLCAINQAILDGSYS